MGGVGGGDRQLGNRHITNKVIHFPNSILTRILSIIDVVAKYCIVYLIIDPLVYIIKMSEGPQATSCGLGIG